MLQRPDEKSDAKSSAAPPWPADPEFRDSSFSLKWCHLGRFVVAEVAYRPVGRQLRARRRLGRICVDWL
jgi:hypothetical protein